MLTEQCTDLWTEPRYADCCGATCDRWEPGNPNGCCGAVDVGDEIELGDDDWAWSHYCEAHRRD